MLDLHMLTVLDAQTALRHALNELEACRRRATLKVSAGRGNHSENGIPKVAPMVRAELQRRDRLNTVELCSGTFDVSQKRRP